MLARLYVAVLVSLIPAAAFAGSVVVPPGRIPEPETLALIGIGVVALVVAKTRKRK